MRSNYTRNKREIEAEARKAAQEEIDKCFDTWAQQCAYHGLAVCFAVLHRDFGFGADRLRRLDRGVRAELGLMEHGFLGKQYNESDIRQWLHAIGIDFEKE